MACLEKIKICGIRSFGPDEEDMQTISFQKPVTLILGENGCGKSTIIECLRYLTAQKEPPGKGSFVHDPNLTNKTIVKGFVKLQITDGSGNRIDLCRQLQSTRTKKTLTTKSLDNVITRTNKETKEKQSISNRCADFSYVISRIFGISRAILENVVFCTQEDSLWPMDTDQKLKEKFDQIFDSDRYNKCVNKVRDKMKKLKESCKLSEVELKHLEKSKLLAAEKKREILKTKRQIEESEQEIETLNASLLPIDLKLKNINEREMEMSKNHTLKESKKAELKEIENYILELKNRIGVEFDGSDAELKYAIDNFNRGLTTKQESILEMEDKINNYSRQEAKLAKDLMIEQGKLGQLLKEEEFNKERVNDRNHNLKFLAVQLDIDSHVLSQSTEDSVQLLLSQVQKEIKIREEKMKSLKRDNIKEENDIQCAIDKLKENSMIAQNDVTNQERRIKDNQTEMTKIKKELSEIYQSISKLSKIEVQLSKTNKVIEELQTKVDTESIKKEIQKGLDERNRIEDRLSEVDDAVKKLQQNSAIAAELDIQKDLLSGKASDKRRLINKHEESLKSLLGEVPESGFRIAVQNHIDGLRRNVKELTSLQTRKEKELTELEMKRKHQKEQLRLQEDKLRSFEEEIYEEIGSDDFDETVSGLQSQIDDLQDVKGVLTSSEFMYQRYIRALQKPQPCCPLCHRDFANQNDSETLIEELSSKIHEVPGKLAENKHSLEEKQKKFNKLLVMRSKHDEMMTLKNVTLPKMRSDLEGTESALKKIRKDVEDIMNRTMVPQSDEAICSSILGDMTLLDQLCLEKKKIGREIERLESRLGNVKDLGNMETLFSEQESLRKDLKSTRRQLEEFQSMLNRHNEELQMEQATKNSLMEEMNKIEGGIGRKKQLDERYDELQSLENVELEKLENLKEKLNSDNRKLKDTVTKKNIQKSKNADELEKLSQSVSDFQKKLEAVQSSNNLIKDYETKEIAKKLESTEKRLKQLEMDLVTVKADRDKTAETVAEFRRDLSNQESRERELKDNLKYREKSRYVASLRKEVASLEEKCGDLNFDTVLREKRQLKAEEEALDRKKALTQGRVGELRVRVEMLEKELSGKMLKTVEADYQKELVKFVLYKACVKDLERYATTMDYAMMTYHKQQMTRVNSFIREYWRKIYQGNDIDFIEIQTDAIETTEKRRNYNYKLVQFKNCQYLEMRNRCSAGQKMLASLIIRMALAETFSGNCGILTLDEPTTNLDRPNVENLARTLSEVLMAKESFSSSNFQLIVITHDEEFLRLLTGMYPVNDYVRLFRNRGGKSRACKEALNGSVPRLRQYIQSDNPNDREPFEDYD